jgi:hypothetical protein
MFRVTIALLILVGLGSVALAADDIPLDRYPDTIVSSRYEDLPMPVQAMRQALLAVAKSGNIDGLAPIFAAQKTPVNVSFGDPDDPIAYLKQQTTEGDGKAMLKVLETLLAAPYAILDAEDGNRSYVWPYLAMAPDFTNLSPRETADAHTILSDDAFQEQVDIDGWFYWRVFIGENGEWHAFVAGD